MCLPQAVVKPCGEQYATSTTNEPPERLNWNVSRSIRVSRMRLKCGKDPLKPMFRSVGTMTRRSASIILSRDSLIRGFLGLTHRSASFSLRPLDRRLNVPHTAAKLQILRYAKAGAAMERTDATRRQSRQRRRVKMKTIILILAAIATMFLLRA
jgi:hypothetical protein